MTTSAPQFASRRTLVLMLLLFGVALAFRLLLRAASGDGQLPHGPGFQGDALLYLFEAESLRQGKLFEWGLALRPPGTAHLLAWLWDGRAESVAQLRVIWCVLGAALAPLVFMAARRRASESVALLSGALVAASHPLLVLSNTLDAETPYLLLSVGALACVPRASTPRRAGREACRGALAGLACLFRAEHLAILLVTEVVLWRRGARPRGLALALALAVLLPWQLTLHARMQALNDVEPQRPPASEAALSAVETLGAAASWTDEAAALREAWPAFARRGAAAFVSATVAQRGGTRVDLAELEILRQAFGAWPTRLPEWPLLVSSTPLNLALAHHSAARRGFSRAPLEREPPLLGDVAGYPAPLVHGLPPQRLALEYLPHLDLLVNGGAHARRWIAAHPSAFVGHLLARARRFVHGAAGGYGALAAPFGPSGRREAADLVQPQHGSWLATLFSGALLAAALWGLVGGARGARRAVVSWPWWLELGLRFGIALASFGYARSGALAIPAVAFGLALLSERWHARLPRWIALALLVLLLADGTRSLRETRVRISGRAPGGWPPGLTAPREIVYSRSNSPAR
ncbi:MAG: hypothetical protein DHS20C15_24110 [Planctomycetota bacterium]|nr:MAG: hypothetical protein DHS20C15_24110 [Planctomycetota bacterium]